jgi:hypothetical protein
MMDELAPLTIWFSLNTAGTILTLLMPQLFPEPSRIERNDDFIVSVASSERSKVQTTLAHMVCCGPSREGLDLQTCCAPSV